VIKNTVKTEMELYAINRAKTLREQANLSQSELAFKLGVSNGFVGQVESMKSASKYNLNHIDKLSVIFNCSPKEFLPDNPINK
jgi:transcriptional regulator with XRE-family HTH domain